MTTPKLTKLVILYGGPSSKTGRELLREFRRRPEFRRTIKKRTDKRYRADVVLRWGTSEQYAGLSRRMELNNGDAVARCTDKLRMLQTLQGAGVPVPTFSTRADNSLKDANGKFYVRTRHGKVRYTDTMGVGDAYCSKPIEHKRREFRVHVFNGEVWAAYEKRPNVEGAENRPPLFNQESCRFIAADTSGDGLLSTEGMDVAIKAVRALGLLFGAVDLVRTRNGESYVVCEVNTSAGLNGPNVARFADLVAAYISQEGGGPRRG